jgi:hypothetical protein
MTAFAICEAILRQMLIAMDILAAYDSSYKKLAMLHGSSRVLPKTPVDGAGTSVLVCIAVRADIG